MKRWPLEHRYTVTLLVMIALVAAVGLGEWLSGYPRFAATAAFFMFTGLAVGHGLGEWTHQKSRPAASPKTSERDGS